MDNQNNTDTINIESIDNQYKTLPLLPVRDVIVFPYMVIPLMVGRDIAKSAVESSVNGDRLIFLSCQKEANNETPSHSDIYEVGVCASILRMMKQPDGKIKILVQGLHRAQINKYVQDTPYYLVEVKEYTDVQTNENDLNSEALIRYIKERLSYAVNIGKPILPDLIALLETVNDVGKIADIVAANLGLKLSEAQNILELFSPCERLNKVCEFLNKEISILEVQQKIFSNARGEIDKGQRDYFLREQIKAIKRELGEDDSIGREHENYLKKIKKAKMPKEVRSEAEKQLSRLTHMQEDSAEAAVVRTYLDWLVCLPWSKSSEDKININEAKKILDDDHYGLEEVKDRILDFLALKVLNPDMKSPILCLVGPPGTGKTSLGRSIARAMGREFVRISMGSMKDEAEIKGHRRTYVGALPGRIIQGMKNAGANNPVFMLDEVDKLVRDYRGDPASALLEVLDPVQNVSFTDNYLDVPFDLSRVLFITTANIIDPIPEPLKDRMEIITIEGYTEEEKLIIAEKYIIPRAVKENGITDKNIKFDSSSVRKIIEGYTRESGLRKLEQTISKVCRKVGRKIVEGKDRLYRITSQSLSGYLGPVKFYGEDELKRSDIGVVTGLAWTSAGGEVLFVECTRFRGKGNFTLTGMPGDVMKESSQAAFAYIKTIAEKYGAAEDAFEKYDYHIHLPEGAVPKDGPSAGITMALAILSVVLQKAVRRDVAMTGEITITGKVLPIGGLKEKLIAAKRVGAKTVIIPEKNKNDIIKLPKYLKNALELKPAETFDEVINIALIL